MEQRKARVAFIVQCHKEPRQVYLLTESLKKLFDCYIFVHLDKNSEKDRREFDLPQVTLLPEEKSVDVRWGVFSQCEATLALIEEVMASGEKFDYIWFISGQDLPIVNQEEAASLLSDTQIPFIEVTGADHALYRRFAKRNDIYYPEWLIKRTVFMRSVKKLYQIFTGGTQHTWSFCRRKWEMPYYFGSCWWCLPWDCVMEMMKILEENPKYIDLFRKTANPDESFFQTLFMRTSYANRQKAILTYIDWSQNLASPRTFTAEQWEMLAEAKKKYAFARKFDFSVDEELCHRVISELCGIR